jgi:hypothetical protein
VAFAIGAALMLLAPGDGAAGLLYLLPALLLSVPLLVQRYPGERRLAARIARARPRRRRLPPRARRPVGAPRIAARGSLLIARSLAVRPPPRELVLT